jgi:tripartite-type tricarboxylate transporter receptor subunit TctC
MHLPSSNRRTLLSWAAAGAAAAAGLPQAAQANSWPGRPVTVVVPFPPGGGLDTFMRPMAAALTKQLNMQVIIDNKGGAGGNVGAGFAAKSVPDGYTWFMGAVHHAIAPAVYPKLDYSLKDDFIPVALLVRVPQVVVVNPQRVPVNDFKEFLTFVRSNPGKLNFGSAGNGTSHHLAGELFKQQTKTFITHIPYRGAGPALQDLVAGNVDVMFDGLGSSAGHIRSGRIKPLVMASEQRSPAFPEVPTTSEMGVPGYKVATWYGLWAPKGTPPEIVARMTDEIGKAFASKEIKDMWASLGSEIPTLTGPAYGEFVSNEIARWAVVAKAAGAKLD